MNRKELTEFWVKEADKNSESMMNMFRIGEYMWSLFVGHLVIEKLLKAYYVKKVKRNVPFIHSVYKLAVKCRLDMTEEQKDALQKITLFNIKTRYDSYKKDFYAKCTKEFTEANIKLIKGLENWIKEKIYDK